MSSSAFNPDHTPWSSMKWSEEAAKEYNEHRVAKKLAQEQAAEDYEKHKVAQMLASDKDETIRHQPGDIEALKEVIHHQQREIEALKEEVKCNQACSAALLQRLI